MIRVLDLERHRLLLWIAGGLATIALLKVGLTLLGTILDAAQVTGFLLLAICGGTLLWQRIRGR